MSSRYRFRDPELVVHDSAAANVAAAYNQAGGDYVTYADGDPTHLFEFDGLHAYADRRVWTLLDKKLTDLHANGTRSIRILDAGCGPGTWLWRLVGGTLRAVDKQFSDELERLEETYATSSGFLERANHLLLVARHRQTAFPSSWRQKTDAARDQRDANDHGDDPRINKVGAV